MLHRGRGNCHSNLTAPLCFQILSSCPEIKWHFIGHLQKNNVNKLIGKLWLSLFDPRGSILPMFK